MYILELKISQGNIKKKLTEAKNYSNIYEIKMLIQIKFLVLITGLIVTKWYF